MTNQQEIFTAAHWGGLKVRVENGKIIHSEAAIPPVVENELLSVVADQVYSDTRVRYPMVRAGFLAGNQDRSLRGRDVWVRLSWQEALDLVHQQLMQIRAEHGAQAIYGGSYGWKSAGSLHASSPLLQRYLNLTGGFVGRIGDYSTAAVQRILPHVTGGNEVYEQATSWENVLQDSEIVVLWGANPLITLRNSWTATDQLGIAYFEKLKHSGKRVISIDPLQNQTCDYLNAEWIPCHTATDSALLLGLAHTLVVENRHDRNFLEKYTEGYPIFERYLLGETDGIPKSAEWASRICGVPVQTIVQLARDFSQHRTIFMPGWGMQRQQYGEQAPWLLVTLAAMLGQIGLSGGGFGFSYANGNGGVPRQQAGGLPTISANISGQTPYQFAIPVSKLTDALLNPYKTIQFDGKPLTYPNIRAIYWAGGNPFAHHADTNLMRKAWQKPDCIIVNEINWTPTARMADIVLPVTTSFERNDLTISGSYSMAHLLPMKQVVAPQFEAKNDFEIFAELAKRAGVEEAFTENKDEMAWLKTFYEQSQQRGSDLPDFDTFWAANQPIHFPTQTQGQQWVKFANFRENPTAYPLKTPSGKIEIFSQTIANMGYNDCAGHPMWFTPTEFAGSTTAEYPLALVTPHSAYRLHSQLANTSLRQCYAVNDREPIWLHPQDAAERNIQAGDIVRVYSPRGQILAGAVITDKIIQGTVAICEGAWYDPQESDGLCKNGNPNVLTRDEASSQLGQGNSPNTCIVQVEKYQGIAPKVTVFEGIY